MVLGGKLAGLGLPPLELVFGGRTNLNPSNSPNPLPCGTKELPPLVGKGMDGDGNRDAPWAATTCWQVMTQAAGRDGRELTVDGALRSMKDKR